uniref:Carboxypeptidase n=1 Tax=Haemonchus contortus TaxID=6289 RepID=A0A7I4Y4U9_HAECO
MFLARLIYLFTVCQTQEIKQLPGVGFGLNFKHYSGFFQVSHTHLLHYWFVESQNKPEKDPLIFWFSGGPGYSSLGGLLKGMGPYVTNYDGRSLRENPYSWNKMASVVYIESPAGVGYSYSTDGNITTNDDQTSLENYEAVKQFFQTFPQFRHHATFIMGESYGGVYVPTLAERIIVGQKDFPINLEGIALGNGWVHEKLNIDTSIRYAYGHGIVDEETWNTLQRDCCGGCIDTCDLTQFTGHCATMVEDIDSFLWSGELNPYDLFGDCDSNPIINNDRMTHTLQGVTTGFKPFVLSKKETGDLVSLFKARESRYNDYKCENNTNVITYMNDVEIRKALNIPSNLP